MGAVWYRARAEMHRTMSSTLLLILFVAVPGGLVLATVAGALRGQDALPDFLAYNQAPDISAFSFFGALPPEEEDQLVKDLVALPDWEAVGSGRPIVLTHRVEDDSVLVVATGVAHGPYLTDLDRPILVAGRLAAPSAVDEVVINEAFADDRGLDPGDRVELRTVTPPRLDALASGQITSDPDGEPVTMTVTGIVRRPLDLSLDPSARAQLGSDSWFMTVGPAFLERHAGELATFGVGVEGRARPGRTEELLNGLEEVGEGALNVEQGNLSSELIGSSDRAIDFETTALLAFALVTLITSIALVGQAIGRRAALDLVDTEILRSAGLQRTQRAAVPVVRGVIVAVFGALGAVALAIAASGEFPIGVARRAEIDPGLDVNTVVLGLGAVLLVLAILGRVAVAGWRATAAPFARRATRPVRVSTVSRAAGALNAPVSAEAGVRMAFERGRGPTAVPVAGAVVAVTAGVLILTATLVLAGSLDRLVSTPALQGWPWDLAFGNLNDSEGVAETTTSLRANELVDEYIGFSSGTIVIDGLDSYAAAFGRGDPSARPPAVEGRLPDADDEVALGRQTLEALDKDVGDEVTLTAAPGAPEVSARIVGTLVLPAGLDTQLTFGRGAVMTGSGLSAVYGDEEWVPNTFLVNFTDGTTVAAGERSISDALGDSTRDNFAPDVENLRRVQHLPRLVAALIGLLALGTLANVLVTSIRRRRRDLATFATLGFRRRQLAATVAWQATTFALLALILGIPLGIATGRTVWRLLMTSIGNDVAPALPAGLLALIALGTVAAANLIAALPARSAARTHPAQILHGE